MSKKALHLIIADDHTLVREGVALLLKNDIAMIQTASCGEEAVNMATDSNPDVILLDLNMPGIGGIEATRKILHLDKGIKILIFSSFNSAPFPLKLMEIGAHGYLYKDVSKDKLLTAIDAVHSGHAYLDPRIARNITIDRFDEKQANPFGGLSLRELQITMLLVHAVPVCTISDFLCISSKTVCGYRYTVFDKLKIENDVQLTQLAYQHQMLSDDIPSQVQILSA